MIPQLDTVLGQDKTHFLMILNLLFDQVIFDDVVLSNFLISIFDQNFDFRSKFRTGRSNFRSNFFKYNIQVNFQLTIVEQHRYDRGPKCETEPNI